MRLNAKVDRPIRSDGQDMEDVDELTCSGSKVTTQGEARSDFCHLTKYGSISLYRVKTKLKIYNSNVRSVYTAVWFLVLKMTSRSVSYSATDAKEWSYEYYGHIKKAILNRRNEPKFKQQSKVSD